MSADTIFIACLLVLLANLVVVGIGIAVGVKLYTEILKDRKFDHRAETKGHDGGRDLTAGKPGHAVFPFSGSDQ